MMFLIFVLVELMLVHGEKMMTELFWPQKNVMPNGLNHALWRGLLDPFFALVQDQLESRAPRIWRSHSLVRELFYVNEEKFSSEISKVVTIKLWHNSRNWASRSCLKPHILLEVNSINNLSMSSIAEASNMQVQQSFSQASTPSVLTKSLGKSSSIALDKLQITILFWPITSHKSLSLFPMYLVSAMSA